MPGYNVGIGQTGGELHIARTVKSFHLSAFDTRTNKIGKIYINNSNTGKEVLIYDGSMGVGMFGGMKTDKNITLTKEAWDQFVVDVHVNTSRVTLNHRS